MALSKELAEFRKNLSDGNEAGALRMLAFYPKLAQEHATLDDGPEEGRYFVTALSVAMEYGNTRLVDKLLDNGARMDLPVGLAPSYTYGGQTSLMRAVELIDEPHAYEMVQCMLRHHGMRMNARQDQSKLGALALAAEDITKKIGANVRALFTSDQVRLLALAVPVTGAIGAASLSAFHPNAALAAIATFTAVGTASSVVAHIADKREWTDKLAGAHQNAVVVFDREAQAQTSVNNLLQGHGREQERVMNALEQTMPDENAPRM